MPNRLIKYHHPVPRTAKTRNGSVNFRSGSNKMEKGKSSRNIRNHPQLPSEGTMVVVAQRHRCIAGNTSEAATRLFTTCMLKRLFALHPQAASRFARDESGSALV